MRLLEVCVDTLPGALNAFEGGADRLELCSALSLGGLTPSSGLLRKVMEAVDLPVFALIRPREGDFVYSSAEAQVLQADAVSAMELGANGVVAGILLPDGTIDTAAVCKISALCQAKGLNFTFHRAFDYVPNKLLALEQLEACKVTRVLTSGGAPTALMGAHQIAALVSHAKQLQSSISIVAGGGVRPDNVAQLLELTGVPEVHSSASRLVPSAMQWSSGQPNISLGSGPDSDASSWKVADKGTVQQLQQAIAAFESML